MNIFNDLFAVSSVQIILYSAVYSVQCEVQCTVLSVVYSRACTLDCIVCGAVCSVQCTVYSVQYHKGLHPVVGQSHQPVGNLQIRACLVFA